MRILFPVLACICVVLCKVSIRNAGVATLSRGDVGMIFYITLQNEGNMKYHVFVNMLKCCENFDHTDMDCHLMHLMGGDMGLLYPNITKNISLIYPNMYLHNRKGQCLIAVKYTNDERSETNLQHQIGFDTFLSETPVNPVLKGYYSKREYTRCLSIDEDPLDKCEPVNCPMKYLGSRNYFNRKWRRCQKVPICVADPDKALPDVSYLPISNTCRDLEDLISVEDLRHLDKGIEQKYWEGQQAPEFSANLRCHHGKLDNDTGFCVCDDGWMSAPLDKDQYEPGLSVYHMCNIEIGTWNGVNGTKVKMTALLIAIFGAFCAAATIIISFICHLVYRFIKRKTVNPFPIDSESQTPYPTDTDVTKPPYYGAYSGPSDSLDAEDDEYIQEQIDKIRKRASIVTAGVRNSMILHRKSIAVAPSDPGLPVVESQLKEENTPGEQQQEEVLLERTTLFQPGRVEEDEEEKK